MVDIKNKLISLITLPQRFYTLGNISMHDLLKETGYFQIHDTIDVLQIVEELNVYPEVINEWINWWDNKRAGSGWFLKRGEDGLWVVGYFLNTEVTEIMSYQDEKEACGNFIKREVESIRNGY